MSSTAWLRPLLSTLLVSVMAGCSAEPTVPMHFGEVADPFPRDQVAMPGAINRTLLLGAPSTVVPGGTVRIEVAGALPGQLVRLYLSFDGPGSSTVCPNALNQNCVEMIAPMSIGSRRANAQGIALFDGNVFPTTPTGSLFIQAGAARVRSSGALPNLSGVTEIVVEDLPPVETADTGDTDAPPPPFCSADDDWWPGADLNGDGTLELNHRLLVDVTGTGRAFSRAPVAVDVDFRDVLDNLGDIGEFDPNSLRVVRQDCGLGLPEVPSQFADRLRALQRKSDHISPPADEQGAVVFLVEEDGDLATAEAIGASETVRFGLYFSTIPNTGPRQAPNYTSDLAVLPGAIWTLETSESSATFDESAGGLMRTLSHRNSPSLTSQADACCGNSMAFWSTTTAPGFPFGWVTPQLGFGTISLVEVGPLVTAIRATGTRTAFEPQTGVDYGTYEFDVLYWMYAHRPEIWHSIRHTAITEVTTEHPIDASFGFRPIQLEHQPVLYDNATYDNDPIAPYGALTGARFGFAAGLYQPPEFFARVANPVGVNIGSPNPLVDAYALHGNEVIPPGVPSPASVPGGVSYFDNIGAVMLPYEGAFAGAQPTLLNLMEGVTTTTVAAESSP